MQILSTFRLLNFKFHLPKQSLIQGLEVAEWLNLQTMFEARLKLEHAYGHSEQCSIWLIHEL